VENEGGGDQIESRKDKIIKNLQKKRVMFALKRQHSTNHHVHVMVIIEMGEGENSITI
jgi:hypothetical protein